MSTAVTLGILVFSTRRISCFRIDLSLPANKCPPTNNARFAESVWYTLHLDGNAWRPG